MAAKRGTDVSALVRADIAGTIASRSGNASVAPIPRMNVRRGNALFAITIAAPSSCPSICGQRGPHLKRRARDDALDQRGEAIVRGRRVSLDPPDRRRIRG